MIAFSFDISIFARLGSKICAIGIILVLEDTASSPQISVCRLRFFRIFEAQGCPDAAWRIDFFQLVVTSFCIDCPMGGLALAAVPRHPDLGFMGSKSLECNGQELIEYMAAGIY
jgi:hypothetical protein